MESHTKCCVQRKSHHKIIGKSLAARVGWRNTGEDTYLPKCRMSHNNNTVIDVTSLLRLWSCRTNHNISATRTQPYPTDGQTDRLTRVAPPPKNVDRLISEYDIV